MSRSKKSERETEPGERFIVFLRHGLAEEPSADKKDEDRALTGKGHARMKEIARGLARLLPKADAVYSSPLLRAVETAMPVSKAYGVPASTADALAPGAKVKEFRAFLKGIPGERVIVIGHEPGLTEQMQALTGVGAGKGLELKKGGCYGVRIGVDGNARLEWLLAPRVLRRVG